MIMARARRRSFWFVVRVSNVFVLLSLVALVQCGGGKYSKEKNELKRETVRELKGDNNWETTRPSGPFRIAKLNAIWDKAQRKLSADDLRSLLDELQIQDKDEITLKRLSSEGGDKDGSMAAELRDRLHRLMEKYKLLKGQYQDLPDEKLAKRRNKKEDKKSSDDSKPKRLTLRDKKLNKLWEKAQRAGFTDEELASLKNELTHHQQKLDEYYDIYNSEEGKDGHNAQADGVDMDKWNDIDSELTAEELTRQIPPPPLADEPVQLDSKLKEITHNYASLKDRVNRNEHASTSSDVAFKEGRVEELWSQALEAGFDRHELASLREELRHFEQKLRKLKNLNDEIQVQTKKPSEDLHDKAGDKSEQRLDLEAKAKHFAAKTDKLHKEIQQRINIKHNEL